MRTVLADLAFSARQLLKRPGFTATAVLALALGTGGVTAMYSLVDAVLLRPLPFPGSDRLLALCETHPSIDPFCVVSPPNAADWQDRSHTLSSIGQARSWPYTTRVDDVAQSLNGGLASPTLFVTLGVRALFGRTFGPADVGESAHVAVLSHAYWLSRYGGDPSVVGRAIQLSGTSYEIVGVLPPEGVVPELEMVKVWTPFPFDPRDEEQRKWRGFVTIGRLQPGIGLDAAAAELNSLQQQLANEHSKTNEGWGARVEPLLETLTGPIRPVLLALFGAVAVLLLIACANVASLLLARATARARELAVRVAIGASRGSVIRLLAVESVLLALVGGAAGLVAATSIANALLHMMPGGLPRIDRIAIDGRVLAAAVLLTLAAGVLSAVAPALRAARVDVVESLKEGAQPNAWRSSFVLRRTLLVVEVALSVVLAVGAGLLGRGFYNYLQWRPGFNSNGLVIFWTLASDGTYKTTPAVAALFERLEANLASIPGVTSVGMTSNGPLFGGVEPAEFRIAGVTTTEPATANWYDTSPSYFNTLGVRIARGRVFRSDDRAGAAPVAIVNETFVRRYLSGREPIGVHIATGPRDMEIVGVVADVPPMTPGRTASPEVFWPFQQAPRWASHYVLRTSLPAESLRKAIERRVQDVDPNMTVSNYSTMAERIDRQLARPRFQLSLVGAFAIIALTLTAIGLHGLLMTVVSGRRRELGLRIALGASRASVIGMVLRQTLGMTAIGVTAGLAAAAAAARLAASFLRGVSPTDVMTYLAVATFVLLIGAISTVIPARTAVRSDPLSSLRAE